MDQLLQKDNRNIRNTVLVLMKNIYTNTTIKDHQKQLEKSIAKMVNDSDREVNFQANLFMQEKH